MKILFIVSLLIYKVSLILFPVLFSVPCRTAAQTVPNQLALLEVLSKRRRRRKKRWK
jgi:hypothetical protein